MSPEDEIIEHLLAQGRLKASDISRAETLASAETGVLQLLERLGVLSDLQQAAASASVLGLPLADGDALPESPPELAPVSLPFLRRFQVLPILDNGETIDVWAADAYLRQPLDALRLALGKPLRVHAAPRSLVETALNRWYPQETHDESSLGEEDVTADLDDIEHLKDLASEAPVIRHVNQILQRAAELGASDIHLEPFERQLQLRYRIDGVLEVFDAPPAGLAAAILSRFKILAKLDIAERRLPQDGRMQMRVQGRELDLRVSTVPTTYGESLVLRLLDRDSIQLDLDAMGFDSQLRTRLENVLKAPHGIVLVTGPTGSGKTTTLYAALTRLNTPHVKILTVEDPVEYQLGGINQIQVRPQIGLDFAGALRSIVRQDPDIILVGEMRDTETARTAIQSALTGHLVLSTLHTNSAAGGLTRLRDMGIENYLVTSTVNALLAQRLVRRLEPGHAERYRASEEEIARFQLRRFQPDGPIHLYRPVPSELTPTGYRGRLAIVELVVMDDALREAVMHDAPLGKLEQLARQAGSGSMAEDGIRKALAGLTTLDEVLRVTQALQ